jgi:hypothetical protein
MSTRTPTVFEGILQSTREEVKRRKRKLPLKELEYQAFALGNGGDASERRFGAALQRPGMAVSAEFKRRASCVRACLKVAPRGLRCSPVSSRTCAALPPRHHRGDLTVTGWATPRRISKGGPRDRNRSLRSNQLRVSVLDDGRLRSREPFTVSDRWRARHPSARSSRRATRPRPVQRGGRARTAQASRSSRTSPPRRASSGGRLAPEKEDPKSYPRPSWREPSVTDLTKDPC